MLYTCTFALIGTQQQQQLGWGLATVVSTSHSAAASVQELGNHGSHVKVAAEVASYSKLAQAEIRLKLASKSAMLLQVYHPARVSACFKCLIAFLQAE